MDGNDTSDGCALGRNQTSWSKQIIVESEGCVYNMVEIELSPSKQMMD